MDWDCLYNKAFNHYEKGELEEALELFSRLVQYPFSEIEEKKRAEALYYRGCTYYKLGVLYEKKQICLMSEKAFNEALASLENALKCYCYKENGKLWFYKGLANYKLCNYKNCFGDFKEAAIYDYYDIEIFKVLLSEELLYGSLFERNLKEILLLYYLKRYSEIINKYSNNVLYLNDLDRLIRDYKYEGVYYCALAHYELKEFERAFEIFDKITENEQSNSDLYFKKISSASWYYKGLILDELKSGGNSSQIIDRLKDYRIITGSNRDKEFLELKESKKLIDYKLWDLKKLQEFSDYLKREAPVDRRARLVQNQIIIGVEAQIAFNNALVVYTDLINKHAKNALYYEKALVLNELKRHKEAIESLDEFLKNNPRNAKAWLKKGTIIFKLAKYEEAKSALEKSIGYFKILIDENPNNPDHLYNMGTAHSSLAEVLIKTGKYQDAIDEYEKAVKAFENATTLNPIFALAWNNKGNAYLKLKKYNKAIEAFEEASNINQNYYLALHNKGDALYSLGKYEEAINIYDQVISTDNDPNVYKSWNDRGLAKYRLEKYEEALEAFDKAIEINPTFADGFINKGLVFYKLEILSKAKEVFEKALELEPGNSRASNNLGVVLAREGEMDRAKKLFENTIQEDPDFILAHANLAELLLNSGGIEEASKNIKNIQIDDKNPNPNMGYIHFLNGRIKIEDMEIKEKKYSEAAKSFEKASSFNVDNPKFLLWSVYAKYLCQKFETCGEANSSEESKPANEKVPSKTEDIYSNELSNSIVCDLGKVLNFCNLNTKKDASLKEGSFEYKPHTEINKVSLINYFFLFSIFLLISAFSLKIIELFWNSLNQIFKFLNGDLIYSLLLIIFLFLVVGLFVVLRSSYLTLDAFEKSILKKRWGKPFHKADQLIKSKIFEFEWLLKRFRSYIRFILNSQPDGSDFSTIKVKQYFAKFDKYKEIETYTLYLLGYFYYKLQDYATAKEKLQECINLKPDIRTDKAARDLLGNIWKQKIKPPFWTYWFNSPVNTWRRRASGTFAIFGILLILFIHLENPQPIAFNESTSNDSRNFIPSKINFYPYIISYYPANNTTLNPVASEISNEDSTESILTPASMDIYLHYPANNTTSNPEGSENSNNNTTLNILTPANVDIYPEIPDNYFDAILLLILILILISPSVRIAEAISEAIKIVLKKGIGDISLDLGPIVAPPEFNFELSPSLMLDVIKRLDENL